MKNMSIGLKEALSIALDKIEPLSVEEIDLVKTAGCVAASDLYALVDSPSMDSSLKDGYAVLSHELVDATPDIPIRLRVAGFAAAGDKKNIDLKLGTTIRVLTGACIPVGADAVVSEEFVEPEGDDVLFTSFSGPGRNILPRGNDVASGTCIIRSGREISPGMAGLLAASGHRTVPVYKTPIVGIIGTGDEIVAPGKPLSEGQLYASNIITLAAWCDRYRIKTCMTVVKDDYDAILSALKMMYAESDAIVTSGGAWTGDRDMMAQVLDDLGWHQFFHRIRIGPGKAVGFGMLDKKPIFILPGGPSSNLMGFLQIALPGLLALSGHENPGLPVIKARLAVELRGRDANWTHFFFGVLGGDEGMRIFHPLKDSSRLREIAEARAVASIPEGQGYLEEGSLIQVQLLD